MKRKTGRKRDDSTLKRHEDRVKYGSDERPAHGYWHRQQGDGGLTPRKMAKSESDDSLAEHAGSLSPSGRGRTYSSSRSRLCRLVRQMTARSKHDVARCYAAAARATHRLEDPKWVMRWCRTPAPLERLREPWTGKSKTAWPYDRWRRGLHPPHEPRRQD